MLVLLSAFAFSTAGLFTRLVEIDVWTMLFWRGLFGGLLIAGYVVWRDGPLALAAVRRIGGPGLVAAGCSTAATICFINALRETTVADVLVINATAPFMTAAMAWAWTGVRERRTTLLASGVALLGVVVIVVPALGSGRLLGKVLALLMTFLIWVMMVVIRQHRDVCTLPAASLSAFLCALVVWPWPRPLRPRGRLRLSRPVRHDAVRARPAAAHSRHAPGFGHPLGPDRRAGDAAGARHRLAGPGRGAALHDLRRRRHRARCRRR